MLKPMEATLIHQLHQAGLSHSAIAERVRCHRNSVRNILARPLPDRAEVAADTLRPAARPGPASKTEAIRERLVAALAAVATIPGGALLTRARQEWGYSGQRSAFYALLHGLRPEPVPTLVTRFEGLPGEFAQFDFGQSLVGLGGAAPIRLHFFVGRLKFSRHMHVRRTGDERSQSLVRLVVDCLNAWGGSPGQWVFDNPKTVWMPLPGGRRQLHADLRQLVSEMNVCVEPCTPRLANQKGSVENLVKFREGELPAGARLRGSGGLSSAVGPVAALRE